MDSDNDGEIGLIDFSRIKGEKPFDIFQDWYLKMKNNIVT